MTGIRRIVDLTGVVQGVGFRPAVYRLAVEAGLGGWIQNRASSVRLALEGKTGDVEAFLSALPGRLPFPARVDRVQTRSVDPIEIRGASSFSIVESEGGDTPDVMIPADLAMCRECRAEVLSPANRRHGYPFTTCTLCGPRYTVVTSMPYDRERTTMRVFPLCGDCRREYENPADRRFHAESIACPACGPKLELLDGAGQPVAGDPLRGARMALAGGQIAAVRGIGGFLLAADAFNRTALSLLRSRKDRPHKPLAVMAPDLATVSRYCVVPDAAAALLESPESPIVILDVKRDAVQETGLPLDLLSPDTPTLGIMLSATPLHLLLARPAGDDGLPRFDLLVMTSGNRRGEPICLRNSEAMSCLAGIADVFLLHDREIQWRNDDSVCVVQDVSPQVWRRARGYAPEAVRLPRPLRRGVLAMGADLKNAIAVGYGERVEMSPHVGDLDTPEALESLEQLARALPAYLQRPPEAVAVDIHPDMRSSLLGRRLAAERGLPVVEVQHHQAHAAACLAENGRVGGLALVMDGTGWGGDGTLWGAELLRIREGGFERLATFRPVPLPGGDAAVRQPARQLVARWTDAGVEIRDEPLRRLGVTREAADVWVEQCRRGFNAPLSHGAGRLFDAFSCLLGFAPTTMTYEGQPAVRMEAAARRSFRREGPVPYGSTVDRGMLIMDWRPAFALLSEEGAVGGREPDWAMAVHRAVAAAAVDMIAFGLSREAADCVALSGGVFMNRLLNSLLVPELERMGLAVLRHRRVPPGDGGVALGQTVIGGA